MEKNVQPQLNEAIINIAKKIRICMDDGFEKNKKQIRHLQREKVMYESFLQRIINMEQNFNAELNKNQKL